MVLILKATDSKFSEIFFFGLMKSCLIKGLDCNAVLLIPDFLMGTSLGYLVHSHNLKLFSLKIKKRL